MPLINCPKCGKRISDKAVRCPNCGHRMERTASEDAYSSMNDARGVNTAKAIKKKLTTPILIVAAILAAVAISFTAGAIEPVRVHSGYFIVPAFSISASRG